jgi:hypothetical protein
MVLLLANYTIWAMNHASDLPLNKKANYLVKIYNFRKLIKLLRPYLLTKKKLKNLKYTLSIIS